MASKSTTLTALTIMFLSFAAAPAAMAENCNMGAIFNGYCYCDRTLTIQNNSSVNLTYSYAGASDGKSSHGDKCTRQGQGNLDSNSTSPVFKLLSYQYAQSQSNGFAAATDSDWGHASTTIGVYVDGHHILSFQMHGYPDDQHTGNSLSPSVISQSWMDHYGLKYSTNSSHLIATISDK